LSLIEYALVGYLFKYTNKDPSSSLKNVITTQELQPKPIAQLY
jgi:hypothetical protein